MGLGIGLHALDFVFRKAGRSLDADVASSSSAGIPLALAGGLVEGADIEDAVGVDVEGDLNLGHPTRCWRNAGQVEAADGLVVVGHGTLALQDVDFDLGLVVGSGAEDLALLGGDGGVGVDELGHHAAQRLDTQRKRSYVEQQHVLHLAGEHTALDGGADGVLWLATFGSNRHNMTPLLKSFRLRFVIDYSSRFLPLVYSNSNQIPSTSIVPL